jgi:hypothetical protein
MRMVVMLALALAGQSGTVRSCVWEKLLVGVDCHDTAAVTLGEKQVGHEAPVGFYASQPHDEACPCDHPVTAVKSASVGGPVGVALATPATLTDETMPRCVAVSRGDSAARWTPCAVSLPLLI